MVIIMSRVTVSSKTMPDGSKAKVITETHGDYDVIYQTITRIFNRSVTVISGTGKYYNVSGIFGGNGLITEIHVK